MTKKSLISNYFKIFLFLIIIQYLFCSFPFIKSDDISNDPVTQKIRQWHQLAQNYLDLGENEQAETVLDSIISVRPDYEAYLNLGRLNAIKEGKLFYAEDCLKRAHQLKRKYSPIYYELGMLYKNGPFLINDAIQMFDLAIYYDKTMKDAYYQKALLVMEYNDYRRGHGKLEKLILIDPKYRNSYDLYLRVGFAFHRFGQMSSFFEKLIKAYPDNPEFLLDYIECLYRDRQYSKASLTLEKYENILSDTLISLQKLNKARTYLALEQDIIGTQLYWESVQAIVTVKEANDLFHDIIFLVNDKEYESFLYGNLQQKKEFFYQFWKSRDPTLTTQFNERISEHYKRLCYARKHNRRLPVKQFLSYFLNDFSKPLERNAFVTLDKFGSTTGSKSQQEIDDMGVIYVRHGQPDEKSPFDDDYSIDTGGSSMGKPFTPVWKYYAKYGNPEMTFKFFLPSSNSPGRFMEEGWCLVPKDIPSIMYATATATSHYEPEFGRFDIQFCQYFFKGDDRQQKMFLYYDLPSEALPDSTNPKDFVLAKEFTLFDSDWKEVYRSDETDDFKNIQVSKINRYKNYVTSLEPGTYHAGLRMVNQQTKKEGGLNLRLRVPEVQSRLKIQGIILGNYSSNSRILSDQKLHQSAAAKIIPNIPRIFPEDALISIYFELYNLNRNSELQTDFKITIKIIQVNKNQSGISKLLSKFKNVFTKEKSSEMTIEDSYTGDQTNEYIFRTVQLPSYPPGVYKMMISVFDHYANMEDSREISFEIEK
jgi:Tfp pilus assembly protein PilF